MVQEVVTVLIADRNRHVREFLRREFLSEGYRVLTAKNGEEVLKQVCKPGPLDVLVLDLDLPGANESDLLDVLQDRIPRLPLVLHTFDSEDEGREGAFMQADAFVEKRGNSVDRLKKVVRDLLSAREGTGPGPSEGGPGLEVPAGGRGRPR
jgi:CheY-like chemotaxis protein